MDTDSERMIGTQSKTSQLLSQIRKQGFWLTVGKSLYWVWDGKWRGNLATLTLAVLGMLYVLPNLPVAGQNITSASLIPVSFVAGKYSETPVDPIAASDNSSDRDGLASDQPTKEAMYTNLRLKLCQPNGITNGCRKHFDNSYKPGDETATAVAMSDAIQSFLSRWKTQTASVRNNRQNRGRQIPVRESVGISTNRS